MGYQKREWKQLTIGIIFLILGSGSDFVVPLYIGWVIERIEEEKFEEISTLCW